MTRTKVFLLGFITGSTTILTSIVASILWFFCPIANPGLMCLLLFRPLKEFEECSGREIAGITCKDVYFNSAPDVKIHGRLYAQKGARKVVLYNHGQGGNISVPIALYKIESLLSTGASVLAYDYRGYGKSTGAPSYEGVIQDARAAFDFLSKTEGYSKDQIIVYGESLGTGVSSELLKSVDCAAVVLESGFVSAERAGKERFEILQLYPHNLFPDYFNNLKMVSGKHPPLLIIGAGRDPFYQHAQFLYKYAAKPTQIALFEKCDHAYFKAEQLDYCARLKKFFSECGEDLGKTAPNYAMQSALSTQPK